MGNIKWNTLNKLEERFKRFKEMKKLYNKDKLLVLPKIEHTELLDETPNKACPKSNAFTFVKNNVVDDHTIVDINIKNLKKFAENSSKQQCRQGHYRVKSSVQDLPQLY